MRTLALSLLVVIASAACSQTPQPEQTPSAERGTPRPDLFNCEGCEAVYEHDLDPLGSRLTIPPEGEPGAPLVLTGQVFEPDGVTPAPGVVLYVHHTNAAGIYPRRGDETGWGRRHGYLRGWLQTDAEGRYTITTIRPGPYPGRSIPAHVHLFLKEPDREPYYIDDVVFEDDPLVDARYREAAENRGGSGIITLTRVGDGTWHGTRDIVLEW